MERVRAVRAGRKNVGGPERIARAVVGPGLVAGGLAALVGVLAVPAGATGLAVAVLAIAAGARMTLTAVTRRCYVSALLGRDSHRGRATDEGTDGTGDGDPSHGANVSPEPDDDTTPESSA
jgi:hypothetical protein